MKLEDQVCSLKLSKRLKELGVKQDSVFYWAKQTITNKQILYRPKHIGVHTGKQQESILYSAFGVSELGEKLPSMIKLKPCKLMKFSGDRYTYLNIQKHHKSWSVSYPAINIKHMEESTLVDAMGAMLEYLLVNGYVKVGDLNG